MFTTSAILTWATLQPRPSPRPIQARRMPRLPHHPVDAGRVGRPQDGADVVRVLDAVEHEISGAPSPRPRPLRRPVSRPRPRTPRPRPDGPRLERPADSPASTISTGTPRARQPDTSASRGLSAGSTASMRGRGGGQPGKPLGPDADAITRPASSASCTGLMPKRNMSRLEARECSQAAAIIAARSRHRGWQSTQHRGRVRLRARWPARPGRVPSRCPLP